MAAVIHSTLLPSLSQSLPIPSSPRISSPSPTLTSSSSLTKPKPSHASFSLTPTKAPATPLSLTPPNPQQPSQPHYPSEPPDNSLSRNDAGAPIDQYHRLLRLSVRYDDLELAKAVHACVTKVDQDTRLANTLLTTYLKLGLVNDAGKVFSSLSLPNVVSYSAIISAYAKCNREDEAIELFFKMRDSGIDPNEFSFVAILTACIRFSDLQLGFQIHSLVIRTGFWSCVYVSNALMAVYVNCGRYGDAVKVFEEMDVKDVASWNTVISGAVKELLYNRAFELFRDMRMNDAFGADKFTVSILLAASAAAFSWMGGREVHAHAIKVGLDLNVSVNNALIGFYKNCGIIEGVVALFESMLVKDVITWTGMVTAYMEFGLVDSAVKTFDKMPIKNCVSFNALLAGFCQNGEGLRALQLFRGMVVEGMELTDFTLTSIVNACGLLMDVKLSKLIHGFIIKFGCSSNAWIEAALLDMCTRCGRMVDAQKMFQQWPFDHNLSVVWTSMICGYARNGQPVEAISLFCLMQAEEDVIVDEIASTAALGVCGTLAFHEMGKQIHCYALKCGFLPDSGVGNAVFSMYSKCGNMEDAVRFFHIMPKHDLISWNALIAGHLLNRDGDKALDLWSEMERIGVNPDPITFVLILSAYRHTKSNLVDDCRGLFQSMKSLYGIEPASEHYASMVSVLGYLGCFEEAEELIRKMPFEPDAPVWRALLDSCRMHSNTYHGRWAAKHLLSLEPQDPSTHILVSNLYSASGRWHCSEHVREQMRGKGLRKLPAQSWIIHQNKVHSFYARDKSHFQTKDIYSGLEILILECIKAGYDPDTSFVLHEVEEYQKKDFLFYHSAKLAVTCGLLMTGPGTPIQVVKNISLCGDCHRFLKFISAVTGRVISFRDSSGFHYFQNGHCSCRDYW